MHFIKIRRNGINDILYNSDKVIALSNLLLGSYTLKGIPHGDYLYKQKNDSIVYYCAFVQGEKSLGIYDECNK